MIPPRTAMNLHLSAGSSPQCHGPSSVPVLHPDVQPSPRAFAPDVRCLGPDVHPLLNVTGLDVHPLLCLHMIHGRLFFQCLGPGRNFLKPCIDLVCQTQHSVVQPQQVSQISKFALHRRDETTHDGLLSYNGRHVQRRCRWWCLRCLRCLRCLGCLRCRWWCHWSRGCGMWLNSWRNHWCHWRWMLTDLCGAAAASHPLLEALRYVAAFDLPSGLLL